MQLFKGSYFSVGAASRHFWPNSAIMNGTTHVFHNLWVLFHLLQGRVYYIICFQSSSNETIINIKILTLILKYAAYNCGFKSLKASLFFWKLYQVS